MSPLPVLPLLLSGVPESPIFLVVLLFAISPPFLAIAAIVALVKRRRGHALWFLLAAAMFVYPTQVWMASDGLAALQADLVIATVLGVIAFAMKSAARSRTG